MYIVSNDRAGQMIGLLDFPDLKVGEKYTLMDVLYTERGFLKVDEIREKHKFVFLVADKWGNRPRTFEYAPGITHLDGKDEIFGNVVLIPGNRFIVFERRLNKKEDPYITILEITDVHDDIDVKVKERFRYSQYGKYINDHYCGPVLRLGLKLLDADTVHPDTRSLFRTLEDVEREIKSYNFNNN
jgi:hypothetical protein